MHDYKGYKIVIHSSGVTHQPLKRHFWSSIVTKELFWLHDTKFQNMPSRALLDAQNTIDHWSKNSANT